LRIIRFQCGRQFSIISDLAVNRSALPHADGATRWFNLATLFVHDADAVYVKRIEDDAFRAGPHLAQHLERISEKHVVIRFNSWPRKRRAGFQDDRKMRVREIRLPLSETIVQISLDFTDMAAALDAAEVAVRAGVDWLEAGTPLLLAEGAHAVRRLREQFPGTPIVADVKCMDGGYGETELMAKAGADMVVVMGQAHPETVEMAVQAGRDLGVKIMCDTMNMPDPVAGAKRLQELGCDYIVHHIGYDMRNLRRKRGVPAPTPLDQLREIVNAVSIPVQAVGGLTLEQAVECPRYGAPLVVVGAPLVITGRAFQSANGDVEGTLRLVCEKVHSYV
jgi:3-hexulose-6-phosphate synthase/6-phospho-3-hexuloisomerase